MLPESKTRAEDKFYSVPLRMYQAGDVVQQDLYLRYQNEYLLFRPRGKKWTKDDYEKLSEFGATCLFIKCASEKEHYQFVEKNVDRVIHDRSISIKDKSAVLHQAATGIAQTVFDKPSSTESFQRSKKVVDQTMALVAQESDAFLQMVRLSSHDFYTYTHCVNVMTFAIGLLNNLGFKDKRLLREAAIGAFLHDIGKSKIPVEVLNKPGKLNEEEWDIMRRHPELGIEAIGKNPVPDLGKQVIVQHHEKINGVGYPYGLKGGEIELVSQVVSLVDAYDAMTSDRVYSKAMKPVKALEIITTHMKGHFATPILEKFIQMLNWK